MLYLPSDTFGAPSAGSRRADFRSGEGPQANWHLSSSAWPMLPSRWTIRSIAELANRIEIRLVDQIFCRGTWISERIRGARFRSG